MLILRPTSKDPEAHEGVGENRTNGHGHEFGGIAPQCGIRNQGLQHLPSKPYQTIAIQDFQRQDDGKASHLPPCRSPLVPKRPVLVQAKTRHCAAAIGQRIVDHQHEDMLRGKAPEQDIENQQVKQGIRPTYQAVPSLLPDGAAPGM